MHLNCTIKSSFFDINYWTWGNFRKQLRHRSRRNAEKSSRAFVKDTQWSKITPTVKTTWQAKYQRGVSPLSKCLCVRNMCPTLNRNNNFILAGKGNKLHSPLVQLHAARYEFQNSKVVATVVVPDYVWVSCILNEET